MTCTKCNSTGYIAEYKHIYQKNEVTNYETLLDL